jgi:hypothetical protein
MSDIGKGLNIDHLQRGVSDGFGVDRLGLFVNGRFEVFGVTRIDEANGDAHRGENVVKLGIGAPVEVAGGDNFVARLCQIDDAVEDGARARGNRESRHAPLQRRKPFFQYIGGWVHEAGIDVSELLQGKEVGGMFRAIEAIGGRAIEGNGM